MEIFDNINRTVLDDLKKSITSGSRISIAAECFSFYAYQALREQLNACSSVRFIFAAPCFVGRATDPKESVPPAQWEREQSLTGTNEEALQRLELDQTAIARECTHWLRNKTKFRSLVTAEHMDTFLVVEGEDTYAYLPLHSFTSVDLGCSRGNNLTHIMIRVEKPGSTQYLQLFNSIWNNREKTKDVTENVNRRMFAAYRNNPPELFYYMTLNNIFAEYVEGKARDELPNPDTGFQDTEIWHSMYRFQKDAALEVIHKLEKYGGCILADSVGLGKTYTALGVIKYYEGRNKNVLVLCPKKLSVNWLTFRGNYSNNPLAKDRFRYDVLYHTDLSRTSGETAMGLRIEEINWGNYDLLVIDESHNFRNGADNQLELEGKENRFMRLISKVMHPGVKTKVLMLSATPVNNKFTDLQNQLSLIYEENPSEFSRKLNIGSSINSIFLRAGTAYREWIGLGKKQRTTDALMSRLDSAFFQMLDCLTIARSRKHIRDYYGLEDIGSFPRRNPPVNIRPQLTDMESVISYGEIKSILETLQLSIYTPIAFVHKDKLYKYIHNEKQLKLSFGRCYGIQRLMSINLLKRMESSVHSFLLTITRMHRKLNDTSRLLEKFLTGQHNRMVDTSSEICDSVEEFDEDDQNTEYFSTGKDLHFDLRDMKCAEWKEEIDSDRDALAYIIDKIRTITPEKDFKLKELFRVIREKFASPINPGNKKILLFTAFSDTAEYLYDHVSVMAERELGLHTAMVTGSGVRTDVAGLPADVNCILSCFSPKSKTRDTLYPDEKADIDILIATDCVSEGQNLQDCDFCINYDIHWNPVRIIQRFGRIDRIGSTNAVIQLVNFWPDLDLDTYLDLKQRVENRMRLAVATATGDDDLLNVEEEGDLEYRRDQLIRLQQEVVDLEEMDSGITIMDLGLNDFRVDLLKYRKDHERLDLVPRGIHAVVKGEKPGAIFVLKNTSPQIREDVHNRLYPFYIVYVGQDGKILSNHLQQKESLDTIRRLTRGKEKSDPGLCALFSRETNNGLDMSAFRKLLNKAVESVIALKEECDLNSLFHPETTSLLARSFVNVNDFELICFLVVSKDDQVHVEDSSSI